MPEGSERGFIRWDGGVPPPVGVEMEVNGEGAPPWH